MTEPGSGTITGQLTYITIIVVMTAPESYKIELN